MQPRGGSVRRATPLPPPSLPLIVVVLNDSLRSTDILTVGPELLLPSPPLSPLFFFSPSFPFPLLSLLSSSLPLSLSFLSFLSSLPFFPFFPSFPSLCQESIFWQLSPWVLPVREHEERGTPGAVEMHTRDIPAGSIALLDSLLVVLLVVSQLGSTSAYKAKCSSDADFQYNGCSTVPC